MRGESMHKLLVGSLVLVLAILGWGEHGVGAQVPVPRGELRIVDKNLANYGTIVFNVFEHLLELDKEGKLVPRLVTSWQWLDERTLDIHLFDNTLGQKEAVDLVKSGEGRVDLVTELSPLETLRVAESPFAKVVKRRGSLLAIFGQFNMRKTGSPWTDIRMRQAVNFAINREDLLRYAAKGNGVITATVLPLQSSGYDPSLTPYPFDPVKARQLLHEAGYTEGLPVILIVPEELEIQATVVSKMLEQVGLTVQLQLLDPVTYNQKTMLDRLDQPREQQGWDIALTIWGDPINFPVFEFYSALTFNGYSAWVLEEPELRELHAQVLRTVDGEHQQRLLHQMERHTYEHAYFLFLYNPIGLYAVNKAVEFEPSVGMLLNNLGEIAVTEQHWSIRKQKASTQEQ
jgi:ABC-type transport system substrate-binding protein